ncbi:unnamed protein product, partial [Effrenium voratum]
AVPFSSPAAASSTATAWKNGGDSKTRRCARLGYRPGRRSPKRMRPPSASSPRRMRWT